MQPFVVVGNIGDPFMPAFIKKHPGDSRGVGRVTAAVSVVFAAVAQSKISFSVVRPVFVNMVYNLLRGSLHLQFCETERNA